MNIDVSVCDNTCKGNPKHNIRGHVIFIIFTMEDLLCLCSIVIFPNKIKSAVILFIYMYKIHTCYGVHTIKELVPITIFVMYVYIICIVLQE